MFFCESNDLSIKVENSQQFKLYLWLKRWSSNVKISIQPKKEIN